MSGASPPYPMLIEKVWLDHRGGTKSYQIMRVTAADGKSLLIWRWGKTGKEGQVQVFTLDDEQSACDAFKNKVKDRERSGYSERTNGTAPAFISTTAQDGSQLRLAIGVSTFYKLGTEAILHVDPDAKTDGVREPDLEPEWEPDPDNPGKFRNTNVRPPRVIAEPKPVEPTQEERVAADPLWGLY